MLIRWLVFAAVAIFLFWAMNAAFTSGMDVTSSQGDKVPDAGEQNY